MFSSDEKADTSVGGRLALWDVAIRVWERNPVLGTGPGDYNDDLVDYQSKGLYPGVFVHSSVHNIYLQALVSTGIVGLLVFILALIVFPMIFLQRAKPGGGQLERLSGLVLIVSVLIFGLTESWTLRSPFIAIFVIYLVVIFAQAGKGLRDAKQTPVTAQVSR
jgi:O-antigen ligase